MVFMKSERRAFKTRSTKYSSSQGAARAKWPLKMTRSKQERTARIKLVNLETKRDSVFMAFSFRKGWCKPYSEGETAFGSCGEFGGTPEWPMSSRRPPGPELLVFQGLQARTSPATRRDTT